MVPTYISRVYPSVYFFPKASWVSHGKAKTTPTACGWFFGFRSLGYRVTSLFALFEIFRVLQIDQDGVGLNIAFAHDLLHDLFTRERSALLQDIGDHVTNDTGRVSPL